MEVYTAEKHTYNSMKTFAIPEDCVGIFVDMPTRETTYNEFDDEPDVFVGYERYDCTKTDDDTWHVIFSSLCFDDGYDDEMDLRTFEVIAMLRSLPSKCEVEFRFED